MTDWLVYHNYVTYRTMDTVTKLQASSELGLSSLGGSDPCPMAKMADIGGKFDLLLKEESCI